MLEGSPKKNKASDSDLHKRLPRSKSGSGFRPQISPYAQKESPDQLHPALVFPVKSAGRHHLFTLFGGFWHISPLWNLFKEHLLALSRGCCQSTPFLVEPKFLDTLLVAPPCPRRTATFTKQWSRRVKREWVERDFRAEPLWRRFVVCERPGRVKML